MQMPLILSAERGAKLRKTFIAAFPRSNGLFWTSVLDHHVTRLHVACLEGHVGVALALSETGYIT